MPFYIMKYTYLKCDNCGEEKILSSAYPRDARKDGWGISKDYKHCYCPKCNAKQKVKGWSKK